MRKTIVGNGEVGADKVMDSDEQFVEKEAVFDVDQVSYSSHSKSS